MRGLRGNRGTRAAVDSAFSAKYTMSGTVLGSGAYAVVMLAQDNETGESVAVKRIDKNGLKHRDMQKLHKEVGILKGLRHSNIVQVYDSYEDEDYFYMVMEYISGGELFKEIVDKSRRFDEEESKEMLKTLLLALKYCNENGVVHRDLKPENILLSKEGDVKIVDFNLAKKVDKEAVGFSILETMCGTPNYVAPEILEGVPYNYKCDVWSMGVLAYLLLSGGYLPFYVNQKAEGKNAKNALLKKVRAGKWKFSPEQEWAIISPLAKNFVSRMLVRDPDARYSYERLLAHPWMKGAASASSQLVQGKPTLTPQIARKIRAAATLIDALSHFEELLEEKPDVGDEEKDKGIVFDGGSMDVFASLEY